MTDEQAAREFVYRESNTGIDTTFTKEQLRDAVLFGIAHERERSKILVEALEKIISCYDDFNAHEKIASESLAKYRGDND